MIYLYQHQAKISPHGWHSGFYPKHLGGWEMIRTDNELMETHGSTYLTDFRHHTWLICNDWDEVTWQSTGFLHGANDANYEQTFGPRYKLKMEIRADGALQAGTVADVRLQFDCRTVNGDTEAFSFKKAVLMTSSLGWGQALELTNITGRDIALSITATVSDNQWYSMKGIFDTTPYHFIFEDSFISHIISFSSPAIVTAAQHKVLLSWNHILAPGQLFDLALLIRSGWGDPMVDKEGSRYMNYNIGEKLIHAVMPKLQEVELCHAYKLLSVDYQGVSSTGFFEMASRKQGIFENDAPKITGLPDHWAAVFDYTLDLMRVATKAPQGMCSDIWMMPDPMFYIFTFYWDTAASVHQYCELDPDRAARVMLTYLDGGIQKNGSNWIQFNPAYAFRNDVPQLMNIPMALWDCYMISRDKRILEKAYPVLRRHQDWIDNTLNRQPDGPLPDLGHNIDYGCELHKERHIWLDVVTFQAYQFDMLGKIARELGRPEEETENWAARARDLKGKIAESMWNEEDGTFYCLRTRDMEQSKCSLPIEFYTMATGLATKEQAARLVSRLMDPAKYAPGAKGSFFCPSVAYDDPSFKIVPEDPGGWGGNIWLLEAYYTICGLVRYGYHDEASAVAQNLLAMVADEYLRTGTIWEQYNPETGAGIHLKYFASGIGSCNIGIMVKGLFGFERADNENEFYFTPRPIYNDWHGINGLKLSHGRTLDISMKKYENRSLCKIKLHGANEGCAVEISGIGRIALSPGGEAEITLDTVNGARYLWKIIPGR